jgi:DNA-binding IscR family transcriptional regulator
MVPTRFAVAIHILLLLASTDRQGAKPREGAATSFWLAARVNTNPVVVRRISGRLARAGLMRVRRGAGGAALARPAAAITLEDIWCAVNGEDARPLMGLHLPAREGQDRDGRVQSVLAAAFREAEAAFRDGLRRITLERLAEHLTEAA